MKQWPHYEMDITVNSGEVIIGGPMGDQEEESQREANISRIGEVDHLIAKDQREVIDQIEVDLVPDHAVAEND